MLRRNLIVLLLTTLTAVAISSFAMAEIYYNPGDIFEAVFEVTANPQKAKIAQMKLDYNHDVLELVVTDDSDFENDVCLLSLPRKGGISVGTPLRTAFRIKENASNATQIINIKVLEAYDGEMNNTSGLTLSSFSIQILASLEPITGLRFSSINPMSISLTWNASKYAELYRVLVEDSNAADYKVVDSLDTKAEIIDLKPQTMYTFTVTAVSGNITSEPSIVAAMTPTAKPGKVTGLKTVEKAADSVTIEWDTMPGAEYYSVYQRKTNEAIWISESIAVNQTQYTFTALAAETSYDFGVMVHANELTSDINVLKSVTTEKKYSIGNTILLGHYEQDNNTANGKEEIEWIVLAVKENKALLISRLGLDAQPFNTTYADVRWDNCTLREWLNKTFFTEAFSSTEQARIIQTEIDNSASQDLISHSSKRSKNTMDAVFLLSNREAMNDYIDILSLKPCQPTEYAKAQGVFSDTGRFSWKLRTPRNRENNGLLEIQEDHGAPYVVYNKRSDAISGAIRPAIWIVID